MLTLVTGADRPGQVGEVVARALAERGDTVIVVARNADNARARVAELTAAGFRAAAYGCDLSDAAQVERLAAEVARDHGDTLDALVHMAGGFAMSGSVSGIDPASVEFLYTINARTALLTTRAFLPMLRAAKGALVYFASEAVLEGARTRNTAGYVMAKSAVVALMRSVADEGLEHGVRANALAPGAIRTATNEADMGADARYVERSQVADAVLYLTSPAASAITGQVIRLRPLPRGH